MADEGYISVRYKKNGKKAFYPEYEEPSPYIRDQKISEMTPAEIKREMEYRLTKRSRPLNYSVTDILLWMSGGLKPIELNLDEMEVLVRKFGMDWFTKLGYHEPEYKKPY